jgi:NADH-quinone oxidoreductase subunit N
VNLVYPIQLELMVAVLALGTLIFEAVRPFQNVHRIGVVLSAALIGILAYSFAIPATTEMYFGGTYRLDAFALFFKRLFLLITSLVLATGAVFSPRLERHVAEHYVLILLASVGMLVLGSAADFILLFAALELVTMSFFILNSHNRSQQASIEAGTKYLVIGGLSTGLLVYGISYVFGITGSTHFAEVGQSIASQGGPSPALAMGILFVLAGLSFKIAAVPGQMWAPDVYQGAPLTATAFLATGSKAAGFAVLLRLLFEGLLPARGTWEPLVVGISAATLLYGNLGAMGQKDIKRLLGYSSIAHAGYLLMGVAAMNAFGIGAILFYIAQYAISSMAGFLAMAAVARDGGGSDLASIRGLHRRSPILAAGLTLSMMSLAGLPPLSGFFGKFLLFVAVLKNDVSGPMLALAVIAAVGVVVSLYYYFSVARAAYAEAPTDAKPIAVDGWTKLALAFCILAMLVLGIYQQPLVAAASKAALVFSLP